MSNYNHCKKKSFNSASYSSKKINLLGNKSSFQDEEIRIIGTTSEMSTICSPIGEIQYFHKQIVLIKKKIIIGNLVDNVIHLIIRHNLILIYRILNHNLLNTTNFNNIYMKEEHNKLVSKMIMIQTKWENMAIFLVEYLHLTKYIPIITLVNNSYAIKKNPTYSSLTSLRTETSKIN